MTAYIVATVTVQDPAVMVEYHRLIAGVLPRYQGSVMLSKTAKDTLEGDNPGEERITVLSFPDEALARAYIASPEYQAGKRARAGGAKMIMRLLVD
jgi:uncharacterized protein (DUF1330 family)